MPIEIPFTRRNIPEPLPLYGEESDELFAVAPELEGGVIVELNKQARDRLKEFLEARKEFYIQMIQYLQGSGKQITQKGADLLLVLEAEYIVYGKRLKLDLGEDLREKNQELAAKFGWRYDTKLAKTIRQVRENEAATRRVCIYMGQGDWENLITSYTDFKTEYERQVSSTTATLSQPVATKLLHDLSLKRQGALNNLRNQLDIKRTGKAHEYHVNFPTPDRTIKGNPRKVRVNAAWEAMDKICEAVGLGHTKNSRTKTLSNILENHGDYGDLITSLQVYGKKLTASKGNTVLMYKDTIEALVQRRLFDRIRDGVDTQAADLESQLRQAIAAFDNLVAVIGNGYWRNHIPAKAFALVDVIANKLGMRKGGFLYIEEPRETTPKVEEHQGEAPEEDTPPSAAELPEEPVTPVSDEQAVGIPEPASAANVETKEVKWDPDHLINEARKSFKESYVNNLQIYLERSNSANSSTEDFERLFKAHLYSYFRDNNIQLSTEKLQNILGYEVDGFNVFAEKYDLEDFAAVNGYTYSPHLLGYAFALCQGIQSELSEEGLEGLKTQRDNILEVLKFEEELPQNEWDMFCGLNAIIDFIEEYTKWLKQQPVSGSGVPPILDTAPIAPPSTEDEPSLPPEPIPESASLERSDLIRPGVPVRTVYEFGDDLYDETFSIETTEGKFLGETGTGISKIIGTDYPRKVVAVDAWVFDKNDIRTPTKVWMTEDAFRNPAIRAELAPKGEAVEIKPGQMITIETQTLTVEYKIIDFLYAKDPTGSVIHPQYFEWLSIDITVWPKKASQVPPVSEAVTPKPKITEAEPQGEEGLKQEKEVVGVAPGEALTRQMNIEDLTNFNTDDHLLLIKFNKQWDNRLKKLLTEYPQILKFIKATLNEDSTDIDKQVTALKRFILGEISWNLQSLAFDVNSNNFPFDKFCLHIGRALKGIPSKLGLSVELWDEVEMIIQPFPIDIAARKLSQNLKRIGRSKEKETETFRNLVKERIQEITDKRTKFELTVDEIEQRKSLYEYLVQIQGVKLILEEYYNYEAEASATGVENTMVLPKFTPQIEHQEGLNQPMRNEKIEEAEVAELNNISLETFAQRMRNMGVTPVTQTKVLDPVHDFVRTGLEEQEYPILEDESSLGIINLSTRSGNSNSDRLFGVQLFLEDNDWKPADNHRIDKHLVAEKKTIGDSIEVKTGQTVWLRTHALIVACQIVDCRVNSSIFSSSFDRLTIQFTAWKNDEHAKAALEGKFVHPTSEAGLPPVPPLPENLENLTNSQGRKGLFRRFRK